MTLPPSVSGQQFIAGRRVVGSEATLLSQHATDGKLTGYHFYPTSHEEVATTAEAADQVFPIHSQATPDVHACFLDTITGESDLLGEDFFAVAYQETALPLTRLQGERTRTSNQLRMLVGMLRRGDASGAHTDTAPPGRQSLPHSDLCQFLTALGPVAVFGASNFPLAFSTAGGDTASAPTAGYSVVVKAHPGHTATVELTTRTIVCAVTASDLPAGVFNMIFGTDIGADLVRHPTTQVVGLTGSLRGGKTLWQLAQRHPQPILVFMEMSAISPLITLPQAVAIRAETLANELVSSPTPGCGQSRTKPGLILVLCGEDISCFMQELKVAIDLAPAQIMLNVPMFAHYEEGVSTLEAHPHIQRLAGSDESVIGRARARLYQAPASLLLVQDPPLQQEVFGSLAVLAEVTDEAELQSTLRVAPDQLTVTVHAEPDDGPLAQHLLPALTEKTGHVLFNGYPIGVEVCDVMVYDGPWPATTGARGTSVGT